MSLEQGEHQSLIEKDIAILYQRALSGEKRGMLIGRIRRIIAYILKTIAAGGSIVIATGYLSQWNQPIGAAILFAVFVDTISSNHKRMIADVKAGYAYKFLQQKIKWEYERTLDSLLHQMNQHGATSESVQAADDAKEDLQIKTHKEFADGIQQIEEALAAINIKLLEELALDNERATLQQTGK